MNGYANNYSEDSEGSNVSAIEPEEYYESSSEEDNATLDNPPEPGTEKALEFGKFSPPLYRQRYTYALDVLSDPKWVKSMSRVLDVGCSEGKMLKVLKALPRVREIIGLDIDADTLEENKKFLDPLVAEYLCPRTETPLEILLVNGSVADCDNRLVDIDAVTAIEVIEHLHPETLEAFPRTIFGHMRPKIVVITTPNREYNVLFESFEGPFRHDDHKFEWTRREFQDWVHKSILEKYEDYCLHQFDGVGEGTINTGPCSQIAVLVRSDFITAANNGEFENISIEEDDSLSQSRKFFGSEVDRSSRTPYASVSAHQYPVRRETRSRREILWDEANYHLYRLAQSSTEWAEEAAAKIFLEEILHCDSIGELQTSLDEVCDVLREHGLVIRGSGSDTLSAIIPFPRPPSDDEDGHEESEAVIPMQEILINDETWD